MNFKEIKELISIIDNSNINELLIEQDNFKINIKKVSSTLPFSGSTTHSKDEIGNEKDFEDKKEMKENITDDADLHLIKSPIVGAFYGSPNPGAEPYVKIGSRINNGDLLCIIEAMKLMNEINSDVDGEIVKIFVKDQDLVEFGQPLFAIRMV